MLARNTIYEFEGDDAINHLEEYIDPDTERGRRMRDAICEKLHLSSLEYQSVEGALEAIGIDPEKICTYCWTGKQ